MRRVLLLAAMVVLLWAGGASAQTPGCDESTYNTVCTTSPTTAPPTVPPTSIEQPPEVEITGGPGLARTGANNIWPLIQAAIVLLGGGTLLVLVARRRRVERRATG